MRNQRGVTLIETMVMVTVIALFSGIAGVPYIGQVERGRTVAAKSQLNAFTAALRKAPLDGAGADPTSSAKSLTIPGDGVHPRRNLGRGRAPGDLSRGRWDPWR